METKTKLFLGALGAIVVMSVVIWQEDNQRRDEQGRLNRLTDKARSDSWIGATKPVGDKAYWLRSEEEEDNKATAARQAWLALFKDCKAWELAAKGRGPGWEYSYQQSEQCFHKLDLIEEDEHRAERMRDFAISKQQELDKAFAEWIKAVGTHLSVFDHQWLATIQRGEKDVNGQRWMQVHNIFRAYGLE